MVEWLKRRRGPVLVTAFSNKGTDHLGTKLFESCGVNVVRVGTSPVDFTIDNFVKEYYPGDRK